MTRSENRIESMHVALSTFMGLPLSFGTNTNVSSFVNLHLGADCMECFDASLLYSVAMEANHTQHYSQ